MNHAVPACAAGRGRPDQPRVPDGRRAGGAGRSGQRRQPCRRALAGAARRTTRCGCSTPTCPMAAAPNCWASCAAVTRTRLRWRTRRRAISGVLDALIAAGFLEVLVKPLPAAAIQGAVRRVLGLACEHDDGTAVTQSRASSRSGTTRRPRSRSTATARISPRCADCSSRSCRTCASASARPCDGGDFDGVRANLHKLRASCGFVGAARLGEAAHALHQQVDSPALLARFDEAAQDTLAADCRARRASIMRRTVSRR